jgi:hypothetical protein
MVGKLVVALLLCSTISYAGELPNRLVTYGIVDPDATVEKICTPGYSQTVRNVPSSKKKAVFMLYKDADPNKDSYEVDHLVSLELGGSNDITNLWPQSYTTYPWNAHSKDRLENKMHKLICQGKLDLPTAQFEIATDWIKAYRKYIGDK